MSVSCAYAFTATVTETLENTPGATSSNKVVTHNDYNEAATIDATTLASPATKCAHFLATLSTGTVSIDLSALSGTNGATIDTTGLKVQLVRVKNLGANNLTIKSGASNGHNFFTATDGTVIPPSGVAMFFAPEGTQDVASGDRIWDLSGTGSQTSEWTIVAG